MPHTPHIQVKVSGDYACFSRPEFKVERVSYPVITPSAARGVLEAIFWKPEFRYEVREILVLRRGTEFALLRNELSDRQGQSPVFVEDQRQQRASLILKNVAYLIRADLVLREHATDPVPKYLSQLERRLARGQCHHQPYLGTREFSADFAPADSCDAPQIWDQDLGAMLFDIAFREDPARREMEFYRPSAQGPVKVSGYAQPLFFQAQVKGGVVAVPPEKYQELYRLEGGYAA
ncbi:MAG: type I-C CRISPR-associated protein Cas5c [Desulfobacca sp.]|uniref:type I-C CRISPR-associated protein Cas5c n=1 Tax=Desulfobacca sp. TaxID=2067990 RepID=UPI00404B84FC